MVESVRRVVIADGPDGTSAFSDVEAVEPLVVGEMRVWQIWGCDRLPTLPRDSSDAYMPRSWAAPAGGLRVSATRFSADSRARNEGEREAEAALQALADAEPCGRLEDPDRPGMHRTDSIEIGVVVCGEVGVEATDGETITLGPGDIYVQNGAMHRWRSTTNQLAHVVFISFGTVRGT